MAWGGGIRSWLELEEATWLGCATVAEDAKAMRKMIGRASIHRLLPSTARAARFASVRRPLCSAATDAFDEEGVIERGVKIVATIGPASEEAEPLRGCVSAGMNVMRINFSHATVDEFHLRNNNLRANPDGQMVSLMLDTKGPEIRMGGLKVCKETGNRKAKINLVAGETLTLTNDSAFDGASDEKRLFVDYARLAEVVKVDDRVLLDDGLISLRVTGVGGAGEVETEVLNSSEIGERKGINLPGVKTGLPAMSDKDKKDIRFGMENDIDMVAASFVRSAEGVTEIRNYLQECAEEIAAAGPSKADDPSRGTSGYQNSDVPLPLIISKIESTEALDDLPGIIAASDGIMVARGDLGVEVPLPHVVTWQKDIVDMCAAFGKPVIVATQMLESMQKNPRPTRAEVADVTNAVLDGADAVMLSGESANGQYPIESVATQRDIILNTEWWAMTRPQASHRTSLEVEEALSDIDDIDAGLSSAACMLANKMGASAIIIDEHGNGSLSRAVAQQRPSMPIVSVCASLKVARQLSVSRGVRPLFAPDESDMEASDISSYVSEQTGLLMAGDKAVILDGQMETIELEVFYPEGSDPEDL